MTTRSYSSTSLRVGDNGDVGCHVYDDREPILYLDDGGQGVGLSLYIDAEAGPEVALRFADALVDAANTFRAATAKHAAHQSAALHSVPAGA